MARSVSTHRHAVDTVYLTLPANEGDAHNEYAWDDFMLDLREVLTGEAGVGRGIPSLRECNRWQDREDHVILENGRCEISVSEYCGLIAVCLAPRDPDDPFDTAWCGRVANSFHKLLQKAFRSNALVAKGRASNGEQFFSPLNRPEGLVTSKEGTLW